MFCLPEICFLQTGPLSDKFRGCLELKKSDYSEDIDTGTLFQILSEVAHEPRPLKSRRIFLLQEALESERKDLPFSEWIERCLVKQDFAPLFLAIALIKEEDSLEKFIKVQSFADFPYHEKKENKTHDPFLQALYNFPFEFCTRIFSVFLTDESDRPKTIWELTLTLQGYYTLFYQIPKVCVTPLSSLIKNPAKRYATILTISCVALLSLYIYVRWFRGVPERARHIEKRKTKNKECLFRKPVLGDLFSTLDGGQSVVVLGDSGVGKSEVLNEVEKRFKKKNIRRVTASTIVSGSSYGPDPQQTMKNQTLRDLTGAEKKVLFVVDEANVFLDKLLPFIRDETSEPNSDWQFLFATTTQQYDALLRNEDFKSLDGRLHKVHLKQLKKQDLISVLRQYLSVRECPLFVSDKALKKVIQLSGKCSTRAQPAAAKYLLDQVCVRRVRKYKLYGEKKKSKALEIRLAFQSSVTAQQFKELQEQKEKEAIPDERKKQIDQMKRLLASRLFLRNELVRVSREIRKMGEKAQFEKKWLYFMNFVLLPTLDKIIKKNGKEYKIPVRITSKLVEKVAKSLIEKSEKLVEKVASKLSSVHKEEKAQ